MKRCALGLVTVILTVATASAETSPAILQRDGVAITGGEICRFRAEERDNPFRRWLASQDVTCAPAGASLSFPSGLWNVFARDGRAAISREPLLVDGDAPPAGLVFDLVAAATVNPLLAAGRRWVAYSPARGSAFPLGADEAEVIVPAGETLWLFVIAKGLPEDLIVIPPLERGSRVNVDARVRGPASVIGWLEVAEAERRVIADARGLSTPGLRVIAGAITREAEPLPDLSRLHGSFYRIDDVEPGAADLRLEGRGWLPDVRRVTIGSGLTVAADPVLVRATGTLLVHWSAMHGLPELNASLDACEARREPQFEITVSACPRPSNPREPIDAGKCSVIRTERFDAGMDFGSFRVEDVTPGLYMAQIRFGELPAVAATATVLATQQVPVRPRASYTAIYGSVSHGGKPVTERVTLHFPGGYGFSPEGTGEYRAALIERVREDTQVTVAACDGAPRAIVLTDQSSRSNARLDLDIPANRPIVKVTDTFTQVPLPGAVIRLNFMSAAVPRRVVLTRTLTTDSDGSAAMEAVPEREIRLSVSHGEYEKRQVDPFSISSRETRTIDVQLVPLRGSRARIVSSTPFENAAVIWFSPSGHETERAELGLDGTFVHARPHDPEETMTVVSLSHPLWVSRSPRLDARHPATIRFPQASARWFDVALAGAGHGEARVIGVVVGGLRVPQPLLQQHQSLRGRSAVARAEQAVRFVDIAETGPIEVLLGPAGRTDSDVPRQSVPAGVTSIRFDIKP